MGFSHLYTRIAQYGHLTEVFFSYRNDLSSHPINDLLFFTSEFRHKRAHHCSRKSFSAPNLSNLVTHAHAVHQTRPPLDPSIDRVDFLIDFILLDHCRAKPAKICRLPSTNLTTLTRRGFFHSLSNVSPDSTPSRDMTRRSSWPASSPGFFTIVWFMLFLPLTTASP